MEKLCPYFKRCCKEIYHNAYIKRLKIEQVDIILYTIGICSEIQTSIKIGASSVWHLFAFRVIWDFEKLHVVDNHSDA